MPSNFVKEIVLFYIIMSIIVVYPNLDSTLLFYLKTFFLIFLTLICLILFTNKINAVFFYKKSGILLVLLFIINICYGVLTFSGLNFLLFSVWFIILFSFFGNYIGIDRLNLGVVSTVSLFVVAVLLFRVCFSYFNDSFNYIYNVDSNYLEIKNVGYNVGRTGWAISLVLYICFLKSFKGVLSNKNFLKRYLINVVIIFSSICVFISDSRTGVIALILLLIIWNFDFLAEKIKTKFFLVIILIMELFVLITGSEVISFLSENTRLSTFSSSDDISNGRLDGVMIGLDIIKNNLIIGTYPYKTYNLLDYGMDYPEIHVVWLNLMALYGLPLILFTFLFISFYIFRSLMLGYSKKDIYTDVDFKSILFLVTFGFFVTFVEPNGVVSFVSFASIYWFVTGLLLSSKLKGVK